MINTPIRVMSVDDHRLMREGIVRILGLASDIQVVCTAATGEEAISLFLTARPDVTLMDLQLKGMSGVDAIRQIRRVKPEARIIVLTMYDGDEDVFRSLDAGASGYLLKDAIPEDLIRMIREVHAGLRPISPEMAAIFKARRDRPTLTPREEQVLGLLAKGMRDKEISSELRISQRTTQVHLRSIFSKLDVHDRTAALAVAVRQGILRLA
jgi:two-component system NarL family response regulator